MEMPKINQRILKLIDLYTNRNVKKFAETIGISQQTVNRLFNIDRRTQKYPIATTEILQAITNMYAEIDGTWLLTGKGEMMHSAPPHDDKLFEYLQEKDKKIEMLLTENAQLKIENNQLKLEIEQLKRTSTAPCQNVG